VMNYAGNGTVVSVPSGVGQAFQPDAPVRPSGWKA
jgi:hypothetical protein